MNREPQAKDVERRPRHEHDWKRADDWDWGPGTVTYECVGCRRLRIDAPDGLIVDPAAVIDAVARLAVLEGREPA